MKKEKLTKVISGCLDYIKKFGFSEKLIRRNPLYYRRAKKLFKYLKHTNFAERKEIIHELLSASLKVNTHHSKRVNASINGLESLPLIDKKTIQKNQTDFLGRWSDFSIPSGTGGSTGVPLRLYRSLPSIIVEQAAIDSLYQENGVEPLDAKIAILRGDTIKASISTSSTFWEYNANRRILKLSSNHLNSKTINKYLDELMIFNPDVIYAYPSSIELFSYLVAQSDREFNVPLIVTSSEVFASQSRNKVSETLGCISCDYYGQAERVAFAYSHKVDEYYFLPGYSYIELQFKYNEDNQDYYEVIGTSFWNKAMPMQRYCTGDLAILPENLSYKDVNFICLGIKPFRGILGRTSEYLLSPEGTHLIGINQIPKFIDNVVQMQFIQNTIHDIDIFVIPETGFNHEDEAMIIKNARKKIPKSIDIRVIKTTQLEKTKAQKTPLVIRKIN